MSHAEAHKLVIVGSGPAGWTAGIYAARAQLAPVLYCGVPKNDPGPIMPGGQLMLTSEVENYPGFEHGIMGPDLMEVFRKQAERFGTKVVEDDIASCDFSTRPFTLHPGEGAPVRAHAVILATGATANWLGLENEMRLARSGGGVSACAVCDGALPAFRGQPLAVVGGGDTALEEASYLTKFAGTVYLIHRREAFRGSKIMQSRFLSRPNAKGVFNSVVVDVLGQDKVEGVMLEDTRTRERRRLDVKGLFVAIGHTPATRFLAGSGVALTDKGYVELTARHSATNIPGVFAAGDVADAEYRQAITAAGMGCQAALDAERWLASRGVH